MRDLVSDIRKYVVTHHRSLKWFTGVHQSRNQRSAWPQRGRQPTPGHRQADGSRLGAAGAFRKRRSPADHCTAAQPVIARLVWPFCDPRTADRCRPAPSTRAMDTSARGGALIGGQHAHAATVGGRYGASPQLAAILHRPLAACWRQRDCINTCGNESKETASAESYAGVAIARPAAAVAAAASRDGGHKQAFRHLRPLSAHLAGGASEPDREDGGGADGDGSEAGEVGDRAAAVGDALEQRNGT